MAGGQTGTASRRRRGSGRAGPTAARRSSSGPMASAPATRRWRWPMAASTPRACSSGREWIITLDAATGAPALGDARTPTPIGTAGATAPAASRRSWTGRCTALGARGQLTALDAASGQVLWTTNLLEQFGGRNISWGISESPLVIGDRVLVSPRQPPGRVRRLRPRETGELLWGTGGDEAGYSSPAAGRPRGRAAHRLFQRRARRGHPRRRTEPCSGATAAPRTGPRTSRRRSWSRTTGGTAEVFLSSDYGTGGALLELRSDGAGGVTATEKVLHPEHAGPPHDARTP